MKVEEIDEHTRKNLIKKGIAFYALVDTEGLCDTTRRFDFEKKTIPLVLNVNQDSFVKYKDCIVRGMRLSPITNLPILLIQVPNLEDCEDYKKSKNFLYSIKITVK